MSDQFLMSLGWNNHFQTSFDESRAADLLPARIIGQGKGHYHLQNQPDETFEGAITPKLHHDSKLTSGFPTVGDWVAYKPGHGRERASIHHVLKRKNSLQRTRINARKGVQLIAANVDFMLIVTSANEDFDLDRLGRYVALGKDTDCTPAFVLTKADLCENPDHYLEQLRSRFPTIESIAVSNDGTRSYASLDKFFTQGSTTVLLGSSGVGKSTLTNSLLGFEAQRTQGVAAESRGRHTTTSRDLRFTRLGGLVMDTPGMQEINEVVEAEDVQKDFSDIEELTLRCKFTNCLHTKERGCKIQEGLKDGTLSPEHWNAYLTRSASVRKF